MDIVEDLRPDSWLHAFSLKFFNTAGPCNPARHYMLPATARIPSLRRLVAGEQYFAIHAAQRDID